MPRYSDAEAPIKKADMIPLALEACPAFQPHWEAFQNEWGKSPQPPTYLLLGDLARYVRALVHQGEEEQLSKIFAVVERWHVEGDYFVRVAATIGFLEGILEWDKTDTELAQYFGPETAKFWKKLNQFWAKGTIITDD